MSKYEVEMIRISDIDFSKKHRLAKRNNNEEEFFRGLRQSLSDVGLRNPIEVKRDGEKFEIISGNTRAEAFLENKRQVHDESFEGVRLDISERRYQNWTLIPARILQCDSASEELEIALADNLLRADMNPMDLSDLLCRLRQAQADTKMDDVRFSTIYAARLGKSQSWVYSTLSFQKLSDEEKKRLRDGEINRSAAEKLVPKKHTKKPKTKSLPASVPQADETSKLPVSSDSKSTDQSNRDAPHDDDLSADSQRGFPDSGKPTEVDFSQEQEDTPIQADTAPSKPSRDESEPRKITESSNTLGASDDNAAMQLITMLKNLAKSLHEFKESCGYRRCSLQDASRAMTVMKLIVKEIADLKERLAKERNLKSFND